MSGSRWVIITSWWSRSLRPFLYSPSVYSCHLLISLASVSYLFFLVFIVPILSWHFPLISPIFFKRSPVFPILLFSSISLHCSFKAFLFLCDILWNSAFNWVYISLSSLSFTSFFSHLFVKLPQTTILPSCISFSFGWFRSLPPVQLWTSVHSSSITLSTRPNPLNLCVTSTV